MGFWNANSDRDWEEECTVYPRRVERTCGQCDETFLMEVEGDYIMHPLCDRCCTLRDVEREILNHAEQNLHSALLDFKKAVLAAATPSEAHRIHQRIVAITSATIQLEKLALDGADRLTKGAA